ncbi:ATP-binding cassette domain-containing protein [Kitasatospora sp. NA04385]|uniref:ABC transporter ATP-binding protein n=1 Tax=Kitasatospora sp. NA04385 TaxID=2742135 RepID=UPI001591BB02|nr:ATP-binding cassette domain-containing protein [Kitasatospora sp. NA04385]QKW21249.1 ATP-binding cassette domain-containing protein [Kitasatospora sp. NA04385]
MTVRLAGVGKRYGRGGRWILRDVALTLRPGGTVRIEGANGTGKSTLLKVLAGVERADLGTVEVSGSRAYVPERFPPALPFAARDYLRHLARVRGLTAEQGRRRADYWLERFGIAGYADTPIGRLSKGTCQKVAVAQALLAEADLLLLDEAWTGLDRAARGELDAAVAERAAAGGLVVFVDHDPARLAGLTTAGHLVRDGALHAVPLPAADRDGPRAVIVVRAERLPAHLPGDPERRPLADGSTRLEVAAPYSDVLLRRLLDATPAVHVHRVASPAEPGGPAEPGWPGWPGGPGAPGAPEAPEGVRP